jgi:hypothetical protein
MVAAEGVWKTEMSGGNSGVESLPSKQMVAGSNPVPRSIGLGGAVPESSRRIVGNRAYAAEGREP